MKSKIFQIVSLVAITLSLGLFGCGQGQGTDESGAFFIPGESRLPLADETITFDVLRTTVLEPFQCIKCHKSMATEAGFRRRFVPGNLEASEAYTEVLSGKMPKDLPPMPKERIEILKRYILEQGEGAVPNPAAPVQPIL